jgi:hypothetical protein
MAMWTAKACQAHLLKLKSGEITTLQQQLNGYRTAITRQEQKIQESVIGFRE